MTGSLVRGFREEIRHALIANRESPALPIRGLVVAFALLVSAFIALSILVVPPSEAPEFNFIDERGSVTALSAIFLAMASGFALVSFLLTDKCAAKTRWFWLVAAAGIAFLATDELLQFHERIGKRMDDIGFIGEAIDASAVRAWNDVIVILYGVVAMPVGLIFLGPVLRCPRLFGLLGFAFGCYTLHTVVDSITEPPTFASVVVEESAKLFCSAFIALAFLVGLLHNAAKWNGFLAKNAGPSYSG